MGLPQTPTPNPTHVYPQALQLKLYQAFIFSIPILFSIILVLLFYLFYLKRRASSLYSTPPTLPTTSTEAITYDPSACNMGLKKGALKDKLPMVLFDEELKSRDSQCCVCLGEFVMKEKVIQVASCKHVFHIDCIHNWLHSNSTCPLCRCSVFPTIITTKISSTATSSGSHPQLQNQENDSRDEDSGRLDDSNGSREEVILDIEGGSSNGATDIPICRHQQHSVVVVHIETNNNGP